MVFPDSSYKVPQPLSTASEVYLPSSLCTFAMVQPPTSMTQETLSVGFAEELSVGSSSVFVRGSSCSIYGYVYLYTTYSTSD